MAIDILSVTRAKAADTPNARAAPPMPAFDASKLFAQMLEQSFASRDATRQQNAARGQTATREERQAPAQRADEPAPRPAAARTTAKERPAAPRRRADAPDDDAAAEARAHAKGAAERPEESEAVAAAQPEEDAQAETSDSHDDPSARVAAEEAVAEQIAATRPAMIQAAAPPKAEPKLDDDDMAADADALAARMSQAAMADAGQAAQDGKPADALAATLQAMTPQQMAQVANAAVPAKGARPDGLRDPLSQAEAALADLLADIGGGSIVSVPQSSAAGTGGQAGGGLLDSAAWSLTPQMPGAAATGTPQTMNFAGLLQAGLAAAAETGADSAGGMPAGMEIERTATTTTATPLPAGSLAGVDGPDMPLAAGHAAGARASLPLPVADQIAAHLGRAIKDEVKAINVQLNPEELGRVDIRLEFSADGRVSAHVIADNQQALDLLQRDQRALERSLTDAGLKTDNSSLSFSLRNDGSGNDDFNRFAQNQSGQQTGQNRGNGGRDAAIADATAIDAAAAAQPRTVAADGALDIKV